MKHTDGEIRISETSSTFNLVAGKARIIGKVGKLYNAERIRTFWNAFNGISTHDALNIIQIGMSLRDEPDDLKYIEHGAEMVGVIKASCSLCFVNCTPETKSTCGLNILLQKLV